MADETDTGSSPVEFVIRCLGCGAEFKLVRGIRELIHPSCPGAEGAEVHTPAPSETPVAAVEAVAEPTVEATPAATEDTAPAEEPEVVSNIDPNFVPLSGPVPEDGGGPGAPAPTDAPGEAPQEDAAQAQTGPGESLAPASPTEPAEPETQPTPAGPVDPPLPLPSGQEPDGSSAESSTPAAAPASAPTDPALPTELPPPDPPTAQE